LLDSNGNCKISNLDHYIINESYKNKKNYTIIQTYERYDLIRVAYLVYQMLTGNILLLDEWNRNLRRKNNHSIDRIHLVPNVLLNELAALNASNELIEFFKNITEEKDFLNYNGSLKASLEIKNDPFFNEIDWIKLENGELQSPLVALIKVNLKK